MKTVNCFELYPSILGAKTVQNLLLEIFPSMHTSLNDDTLEMYITKEEYVFVLNELSKLNNYALTMPKDVDDETLVSDRERDYTDFLIGKKFSASFDLDKEYQDYLNQKTLLGL